MKSYLVTGAGSGIGLAITQALSDQGQHVYAAARRDDDLVALASLPHVSALRLDVCDGGQIAAARARIDADGGALDGLVHNAGIGELGHLVAWSDADLQRLFDVNVFGPQRLTRELLQPLLRAGGRVVCIGSQGGSITQPLYGPYTMSKHALEAFAACLRQELAPHGVGVCIVQPGAVATRITATASAASSARLRDTPPPFDAAAKQVLAQWQAPPVQPDAAWAEAPESATHRKPAAAHEVAEVVLQALLGPPPPLRFLVGTRWEGDRVLAALAERLVDAATSRSHRLSREETLAWVAREIDRR